MVGFDIKSWLLKNKIIVGVVVVLVLAFFLFDSGPKMTRLEPHFVRNGTEVIIPVFDTQAAIGGRYLIDKMFIDVIATNLGTEVDINNAAPNIASASPAAFAGSLVTPVAAKPSVTILKNGGSEMWVGENMSFVDHPSLIDGDGVCDEPTRFSVGVDGTFYESNSTPTAPISANGFVDILICPDECTDGTNSATCSSVTEGKKCEVTTTTATLVWDSSCCTDPRFHWDGVACVENTCTDGTLHDQCSTVNIGQFCNTAGNPIDNCQTCGCVGLVDGMGNPFTCNVGTGQCDMPTYTGDFIVSVSRG